MEPEASALPQDGHGKGAAGSSHNFPTHGIFFCRLRLTHLLFALTGFVVTRRNAGALLRCTVLLVPLQT